ncbi:MAG: translational GTPase TypA [Bdellovibrionales bacterium]|nr:translational GTPase TypA [Bdellovibrionales bacterium]
MIDTKIRNIAIIAHVDHGKTTLVDFLLKQSGAFRSNQAVAERYMDSMDLEKERGITIQAKNASFVYKDYKVNIVDTPGHSDFGGEVERILNMVDGVLLLVDASEGPLPQTRFVLKKALEQNLKVIVVVNKIDRPDQRIDAVVDEVFNLFIDLDATDEQADFPIIYTIAREGKATLDPKVPGENLQILFDWIVEKIPPPKADPEGSLQILVSNLSHSTFVGRLAIGRIYSGKVKVGDEVGLATATGNKKFKVTALFSFSLSEQTQVKEMSAGDIAVIAGAEDFSIGDTITSVLEPRPLPRIEVEEPTVAVMFMVNDGPFAGREGKLVTTRNIKERLEKELLHNVAIRVEDTESTDRWKVIGRGELQLCVLMEQMRREGYEFMVSKPKVILRQENGKTLEPMEHVVVDVDENYAGAVTKKLGERKGVMVAMDSKGSGRTRIEFKIPSRGLIGYRSEFLTDTRGTGLLNTNFDGYEEYKGDFTGRTTASIISDRAGKATPYALDGMNQRGRLFINPGVEVYEGMVVGEANKGINLNVNVVREKKLTNHRASGSEEKMDITVVKPLTLEDSLEWITDEELIEVTPKNVRIRCRHLDPHKR